MTKKSIFSVLLIVMMLCLSSFSVFAAENTSMPDAGSRYIPLSDLKAGQIVKVSDLPQAEVSAAADQPIAATAAVERNGVYMNSTQVYPVFVQDGQLVADSDWWYRIPTQTYAPNYPSIAVYNISKSMQNFIINGYWNDYGIEVVGWYFIVNFTVESANPISLTYKIPDFMGATVTEPISSGSYTIGSYVFPYPPDNEQGDFTGYLTYQRSAQNGGGIATSAFSGGAFFSQN